MVNDEQDHAGGVRPARPHHKLTEDGRRVREVLTYARRGSRFTPKQQAAWDEYAERWVVPDEAVDEPGFSWTSWFGREAPLVVDPPLPQPASRARAQIVPSAPSLILVLFMSPRFPSRRRSRRRV